MLTAFQASMGITGFIIVQDDEEAALDLPRTYGIDSSGGGAGPEVRCDARFSSSGLFGELGAGERERHDRTWNARPKWCACAC